nr:Hpt domain-containing protein [Sulfitobacter aestuariivivens]
MGSDFAAELIETFLNDAPNMIADLKKAAAEGDADGYRRAAHSIKSNADTFGAVQLAAMARSMELGGLPDADAPIPALEATYAASAEALKGLMDE